MNVIRSDVLGFCMGVRRAVDMAASCAKQAGIGRQVRTLGPLIHNPRVLASLESIGVKELAQNIDSAENFENMTVIIRAHGISAHIEEELRAKGFRIVDATCPKVKKSQLAAKKLASENFFLFIAGEKKHAEIEGVLGYAASRGDSSRKLNEVVENAHQAKEEAAKLYEKEKNAKTAVIGQTTISQEEYDEITSAIKQYFPNAAVWNSICHATKERQNSLSRLLEQVDAVVVAGGKESANTRRLLAIAQAGGKPSVIAESAEDIPASFKGFKNIGLCAGASTPDSLVDEIELCLKS